MKHGISAMAAILLALLLAGCGALSSSAASGGSLIKAEALFAEGDLQPADLTRAVTLTVTDGEDLSITEAGVYVLTGSAGNASVRVEAPDGAEVWLVLDSLGIENTGRACISILRAGRAYVTTAADSSLTVRGSFASDGEVKADGAIFSRPDLVLSGAALLTLRSGSNGVVCEKGLRITGGSYEIAADSKAIAARDSIGIAGGRFALEAGTDALHAENDDDDTLGWICITGGDFRIAAGDDAIHAVSAVQIDGGSFVISAWEGIEATCVQLNGGALSIEAEDDGVNAGRKSRAYSPTVEIRGGELTIDVTSAEGDGIDSNGDVIIRGGTVRISGEHPFDYDGRAVFRGAALILNGEKADRIPG